MENYDIAIQQLKKAREENGALHFFIEMNERCQGSDISSYLIMPIQRLPRYILLLQELLKNTPDSDVARQDLNTAFDTIRRIAEAINSSLNSKVAFNKVKALEEMFEKDERFQLLANGSRYLVKQGPLKKRYSKKTLHITKVKIYVFFLFNDLLVYATASKQISSFIKKGSKDQGVMYKMKNVLPLDDMKVTEVWGGKQNRKKDIQLIAGKRELVVNASDPFLHNEWLTALTETVNKLKESRYEMEVQNFDGAASKGRPKSSKLAQMFGT